MDNETTEAGELKGDVEFWRDAYNKAKDETDRLRRDYVETRDEYLALAKGYREQVERLQGRVISLPCEHCGNLATGKL